MRVDDVADLGARQLGGFATLTATTTALAERPHSVAAGAEEVAEGRLVPLSEVNPAAEAGIRTSGTDTHTDAAMTLAGSSKSSTRTADRANRAGPATSQSAAPAASADASTNQATPKAKQKGRRAEPKVVGAPGPSQPSAPAAAADVEMVQDGGPFHVPEGPLSEAAESTLGSRLAVSGLAEEFQGAQAVPAPAARAREVR